MFGAVQRMKKPTKDYEKAIKLKFRLVAKFYDLADLVFIFDKETNPRHALARKIPNEALHILDACVGTANSSIIVAEANDQNEIIGIDLSPDMIAVAKKKIQKRGIMNIHIRRMDATEMSFQDGEFDIAMISFGLHELGYELMIDILKEMHRVLKDGGKLYIIDYEREDGLIKNLMFSIYLKIFEPKHMPQFLKYDWVELLRGVGFHVTSGGKYRFSKMISATKQPSLETESA